MPLEIYPVHGPWPGRLAISLPPRSGAWLEQDLRQLKSAGYDCLVSALTGEELEKLNLDGLPEACRRHAIQHVHFPIGNLKVPSREVAVPALHRWCVELESGRGIAMHCFGSVGRSPTLAASLLVLCGIPPDLAWQRIQQARGREVPDTLEQRRWVEQFVVDDTPARSANPAPPHPLR